MPLTCPACRATNDAPPACRRCKADLSLLWAVEAGRERALAAAHAAVARRDWLTARRHAVRAHRLRAANDSRRLCAALALLTRDFAAARSYHDA